MIDDLPPRETVDEAIATTIQSFDDEMELSIHAFDCPGDIGCSCRSRPLIVPGQPVTAIWWWMRRLKWKMSGR